MISVVSVSYNCVGDVDRTVQSLLAQTFADYEYIVIDGLSTDGTMGKVREYEDCFSDITIISEKDKGIYDAMNKAVIIAAGEYIFFLNMGDVLYDSNTLKNVAGYLEGGRDLYYGNIIWGDKRLEYPEKLGSLFFLREKMVCHQAIFARTQLLKERLFDLTYEICADRDWLSEMIRTGKSYQHMDLFIVFYDINGKSGNYKNYSADSVRIIRKDYGFWGVLFVKIKRWLGLKYADNDKD